MELRLLGSVDARSGQSAVQLGVRRQRLVLGILALEVNALVPMDRLIALLWPESHPASARAMVQSHASRLRTVLAKLDPTRKAVALSGGGPGYMLCCDPLIVDAHRFRTLVVRARDCHVDVERVGLLNEALSLWRGPALAGVASEEVRVRLTRGLAEAQSVARVERVDTLLRMGKHSEVIGELTELVTEQPHQQRVVGQLMLALYRAGRTADALQVFQDARRGVADELGLDPGTELQELHAAILRCDPDLEVPGLPASATQTAGRQQILPPSAPTSPPVASPVSAGTPIPAQLPAGTTCFVGRAEQMIVLHSALARCAEAGQVVAVTGPAGVGKTALALHFAHQAADQFPDGQLYVDMRGHAQTPAVTPLDGLARLLRSLGVPAEQVPVDLTDATVLYRTIISGKRMLVLLDDVGSADQVRPLLPGRSPSLVVVTSRDRLTGMVAVNDAQRLVVEALTPEEALDLLRQLLGDRVDAELDAAVEIGRLCAYLPLAIRVAAASMASGPDGSLSTYLGRLRQGNRLAVLDADGDEQAAVQTALDLSYQRLKPTEQRVFRLLGLIPGSDIAADAVAALADATPEAVERSLQRLASTYLVDQPAAGRYSYHDLLRQYAAQRAAEEESLAERDAALDRLYGWYLHWCESARLLDPRLMSLPAASARTGLSSALSGGFTNLGAALAWLDAEHGNLVAATRHIAVTGSPHIACQFADCLRGYFSRRHPVDWLALAQIYLDVAVRAGDPRAEVAAHQGLAHARWSLSQHTQAIEHLTAALALTRTAGWKDDEACVAGNMGLVYADWGQTQLAIDQLTNAATMNRRAGNRRQEAANLINLGHLYNDQGQLRRAVECQTRALDFYRRAGLPDGAAAALNNLAHAHYQLGELTQALAHLDEALGLHHDADDRSGRASSLCLSASIHRDMGQPREALDHARQALDHSRTIGDQRGEISALTALGSIHHRLGNHQRGTELCSEALDLASMINAGKLRAGALLGLAACHLIQGRNNEAYNLACQALTIARQAGFRLLEGQALGALAKIHLSADQPSDAAEYAHQALIVHLETGHRPGRARALLILYHAATSTSTDSTKDNYRKEAVAIIRETGLDEPIDHFVTDQAS
jgi:DNA-binding SARP family transcriptional activator/tetratricopeptide (TPR) repeat protein